MASRRSVRPASRALALLALLWLLQAADLLRVVLAEESEECVAPWNLEYYYTDEGTETRSYMTSLKLRSSVLLIVTGLIILSILFELGKDKIEETTSEEMEPIVEHLWQEMTVLGFLSVLSFLIVKLRLLHPFSCLLFDSPEELDEMLEDVRMMLFAVMVVFIFLCLLLVRLGESTKKEWVRMEHACHSPETVTSNYYTSLEQQKRKGRSILASLFTKLDPYHWSYEQMYYMVIRQAFVKPRDSTKKPLPYYFDLSVYFSYIMGDMLGELVEISVLTWFFLWVFFVWCYIVTFIPLTPVVIIYMLAGWGILIVFFSIRRRLEGIRLRLIPTVESLDLRFRMRGERQNLINSRADAQGPGDPLYLNGKLKRRSVIGKKLLGPPPNKHQLLFPFDRKGPKFILASIRFFAILTAIYVAALPIICYIAPSWWWTIAIVPVSLLPVFIAAVFLMPVIIRRWVICCNIEMMKKEDIITRVLRLQKTKKSLRALKVIQLMKFKTRKARPTIDKDQTITLDDRKKQEMREVFKMFDKDGSGQISSEELSDVFATLGQELSPLEAREMIKELDVDGDGELSFEEFSAYLHSSAQENTMDPEELVASMFSIFDSDMSGSITAEEFKTTLMKLGAQMTLDDIQAIIDEIDEDQDGNISMEEFAIMIKKHLLEQRK